MHRELAARLDRRQPRDGVLRRDLRYSIIDGVAFSVMVGIGELYLARFALAIGVGESAAGLLVSVPLLIGATLQLTTPRGVRWLGSMRAWVVLCVTIQALSFVPLALGAAVGYLPTLLLFALVSLYWASGMASGPPWMTWITTIVPQRVRLRYFARRSRMLQAGQVLAMLCGGLIIELCLAHGSITRAFAIMFLVACASRLVSVFYLARHSQPVALPLGQVNVSPGALRALLLHSAGGRLLAFQLLMQLACYTSGPFFTPYMINHLKLDDASYVVLISITFVSKVLTLPLLGQLSRRFGTRAVLAAGAAGVALLPALWLVSGNFWYLLAVQCLAGLVWAAFELTSLLLSFELIPEQTRTSIFTSFNLANASCMVGGSLVGAALLKTLGENLTTYYIIFALSSGLRMLTLLQMTRFARVRGTPSELAMRAAQISAGTSGPADERAVES